MTLGARIEERLGALGITQAELARRAKLPQTTVNSLIRKGRRSSPHLVVLARELGTTAAYLAGDSNDPTANAPMARAMSSDARELLDCFEVLQADERREVLQITRRLAALKLSSKSIALPSTAALADAMSAFLEASPGLTGDELAHELAMSLPIILRGAADEITAPHSDQRDTDPAPRATEHAGRRAVRPGQHS